MQNWKYGIEYLYSHNCIILEKTKIILLISKLQQDLSHKPTNLGIKSHTVVEKLQFQSINQTRQFLTRRNTAKPLQGGIFLISATLYIYTIRKSCNKIHVLGCCAHVPSLCRPARSNSFYQFWSTLKITIYHHTVLRTKAPLDPPPPP